MKGRLAQEMPKPRDPLIDFLKKRTRRRFTRLVRQTHRQVLDATYRVTGDRHLAEDITQDVFVKLLTVRWDPGKIRSGIALLTSTAILTALMKVRAEDRRLVRERESVARQARNGPSAHVDDVMDLREAILGLPEALQACIRLRYYGGLSPLEIAAELGCSASTVRERLAQAREKLLKRLRPGAWLIVLPAFSGEAQAGLPSIDPSPALREVLFRLGRDGPSLAAIAGCGGGAIGASKTFLASAILLAAALGTWAAWPSLEPEPGTREATYVTTTRQPAEVLTPVAQAALQRILVRLEADGEGWPPAVIPVRVSGKGVERVLSSQGGASLQVHLPPGSYTIEADGRPDWTRETARAVVEEGGQDPLPVVLRHQDFYDLQGVVLSSEGTNLGSRLLVTNRAGDQVNEVHTPNQAAARADPSMNPGEFRLRLKLRERYEILALPERREFRSTRERVMNPEGLRELRKDIVLDRAEAIRGVLLGCDGMPPEEISGRPPEIYVRRQLGEAVTGEIEDMDRGTFYLNDLPRDPFILHVHCPGYAPAHFPLDPAFLTDPLVVQLDCSETFYGRVDPPKPRHSKGWDPRWNLSMEGLDLQDHRWVTEEDGTFLVHGKDLRKASLRVQGMGFEDLFSGLAHPSSRENPAILRPVEVPEARVEVTVDVQGGPGPGTAVCLSPVKRQDWWNVIEAREAPLTERTAVFEKVFPARYDVVVTDTHGTQLGKIEDQSIRGPLAAIYVRLPSRGLPLELKGTEALGPDELVLRLDDDLEVIPLPSKDGAVVIPALPGWHLVELRLGREEVIYRGQIRFREDRTTVLDLSRLVTLEVARNSTGAPLALTVSLGSREDGLKQSNIVYALRDGVGKTVIRWLEEAGTSATFVTEFGCYLVDLQGTSKLDIGLGLLETLQVPIVEGTSVRTFLLGKVAGQNMVYWQGSTRPAASGNVFEVPLECKLSDWALLLYEGRVQSGGILNGSPLVRQTSAVHVSRVDGSRIAGALATIQGREILGLDLARHFTNPGSRSIFFTLATGITDDAGKVELTFPVYPAMDLKVVAEGQTVRMDVSPGRPEIKVQVGGH